MGYVHALRLFACFPLQMVVREEAAQVQQREAGRFAPQPGRGRAGPAGGSAARRVQPSRRRIPVLPESAMWKWVSLFVFKGSCCF